MVQIKVVSTRQDVKKFADFPIKLYKDCPYYVPSIRDDERNTFNPKKNFSLQGSSCKGFLAYQDGKVVGRILGIISIGDKPVDGKKFVRFSRFECIDDINVFKALLGAVEQYGKENDASIIHGPWGFNDQDREGLLTFGFDERSTYATNYSYPYFYKNLETLGFEDESKWIERSFTIPQIPYKRILELSEKIKEKLDVVDIADTLSLKQILANYGDKFFDLLNEAYGELDGYVPVEGDVRKNILKQFATIVNTKYISILVDKDDNVAAFGVVFPSICDALIKHKGKLFPTGFISVLTSIKKPKELEMAVIGVSKKYKNTGINSVVMSRIMKNVIADGIQKIESNPMLETNYSIQQQWKFAENKIIKKRQTYKKEIGEFIPFVVPYAE